MRVWGLGLSVGDEGLECRHKLGKTGAFKTCSLFQEVIGVVWGCRTVYGIDALGQSITSFRGILQIVEDKIGTIVSSV